MQTRRGLTIQGSNLLIIERKWEMPSKNTFSINAVREIMKVVLEKMYKRGERHE